MDQNTEFDDAVPLLGGDWFDPLEVGVRQRIRSFIEAMLESELNAALNWGGMNAPDRLCAARARQRGTLSWMI